MVAVLIVEDHPLFRDALGQVIAGTFDVELLTAATVNEALRLIETQERIALVLLDLKIPDSGLFHGLTAIKQRRRDMPVLVVSALLSRAVVAEALQNGAAGFIPKSSAAEEITAAVASVLSGVSYVPESYKDCDSLRASEDSEAALLKGLSDLTEQQRRVLKLVNQGKLNKQIAHELGIAERTVKAHVTGILRKLHVTSRTQAALTGARLQELQLLD